MRATQEHALSLRTVLHEERSFIASVFRERRNTRFPVRLYSPKTDVEAQKAGTKKAAVPLPLAKRFRL